MTAFKWTATDKDGTLYQAYMEASDKEAVASKLRARGYFPDSILADGEVVSPPPQIVHAAFPSMLSPACAVLSAIASLSLITSIVLLGAYDVSDGDVVNIESIFDRTSLIMIALSVFIASSSAGACLMHDRKRGLF